MRASATDARRYARGRRCDVMIAAHKIRGVSIYGLPLKSDMYIRQHRQRHLKSPPANLQVPS